MNRMRISAIAGIVAIAAFLWFRFANDPTPQTTANRTTTENRAGQHAASGQVARKTAAQTPTTARKDSQQASRASGGGRPGGRGGRPPSLVVTKAVSDALINDRLKAVGNGKAVASVSVVPLSGGLLKEIRVKSGQRVDAGTVLALLDGEEQTIARDRAARTYSDAQTDATRLAKLFRSNTATEVELNRANAALADAELALREAELTLSRRTVTAPIAGIVGLVSVDSGNYVTPQSELVTIDDRSTIVVEFWIPERFASQIAVDQHVEATALALPGIQYHGVISGISSRIESDSRTLKVQAHIDNADDSLRPGMSFEVSMSFRGQRFPAVDPLAVQWDSSGSYVWKVQNNTVSRVPVRIIQRNPESVLVEADLLTGDSVVTEGVLTMRPGATVRVQGTNRTKDAGNNQTGTSQTGTAQQRQSDRAQSGSKQSSATPSDKSNTGSSEAATITGKQQGS